MTTLDAPPGSRSCSNAGPGAHRFPVMSAQEAAELIPHGSMVAFSGFTPAGAAKVVPAAIADRAKAFHEKGEPYQIKVLTGASTGVKLDEALAQADAISWRAPYQSSKSLRANINSQKTQFLDMHLSHVPQSIEFGFVPNIDFAVIECTGVTPDGRVYLTTSGGISPSALRHADKVILEINHHHTSRLAEMHDVVILPRPPYRSPIPIHDPLTKIGTPFARCFADKIVAVVENDESDGVAPFSDPDEASNRIAEHVVKFLADELAAGRIPSEFLPLQSGVGNVANAVLAQLGADPAIPPFMMYTEVFQDACVPLMKSGDMVGASTTALTLSDPSMAELCRDMDFFAPRVVIRPQEMSNNPGVVRRLGVIACNTAIEADIYGHVNSTHICGTNLMNGIGGSGDFIRNAYLSIFVAPSIAKKGDISAIVPMCSHVDHNEHSVAVIVTDQGLADLRGLGPRERAQTIIHNCAHPDYRDYLLKYLNESPCGHLCHDLTKCFDMHRAFMETGSMKNAF